ncbi:MAG TPA: hypothetical protein VGH99_16850 [Pseudonocardia sp.]|jgi:hypothetical protein
MSRWVPVVLGVVVGLVFLFFGVVWTLQGANLLGGSFMSGSPRWLVIGLFLVAAGATLLVRAALRARRHARH